MASVAPDFPVALLQHPDKPRTIAWIRELKLPTRFRRQMLRDWGEHCHIDVTAADYAEVSAPFRVDEGLG